MVKSVQIRLTHRRPEPRRDKDIGVRWNVSAVSYGVCVECDVATITVAKCGCGKHKHTTATGHGRRVKLPDSRCCLCPASVGGFAVGHKKLPGVFLGVSVTKCVGACENYETDNSRLVKYPCDRPPAVFSATGISRVKSGAGGWPFIHRQGPIHGSRSRCCPPYAGGNQRFMAFASLKGKNRTCLT